jgi:Uma2 family endonuclease
MSTTTKRLGRDHWQQIPATWGAYVRLLHARGERPAPKYTFCNERLTIVSPGASHEALKARLAGLIEDMFVELSVPFQPFGSLTLRGGIAQRKGTEGDSCYYLTNIDRVRGKKKLTMSKDPAPDLVIEVVISHPVRDALKVHSAFGVREVWVCTETELELLVLGPNGLYVKAATSDCLPFVSSDELSPWVYRDDLPDEGAVRRHFREWVRSTLACRIPTTRVEDQGKAQAEGS